MYNVFLYERDSLGNEKFIKEQDKILRDYVNKEFGECNIKVYIDKCGLSKERNGLKDLLKDLESEKVDWVISTHSNRFYRKNYEQGKEKLKGILKEIKENGSSIAFACEVVKIEQDSQINQYINKL